MACAAAREEKKMLTMVEENIKLGFDKIPTLIL